MKHRFRPFLLPATALLLSLYACIGSVPAPAGINGAETATTLVTSSAPLSSAALLPVNLTPSPAAQAILAANPFAPAVIVISDTVVAQGIEPLGFNLTTLAGGTNLATNNLIWSSGMEPAVARYLIRVERTGPGWIEWDESLGGIHMFDQNATGFGDGATVRLYRIVDADGQPLSYSGGTDLGDVSGADHVVFLGETTVPTGGWIAEGSAITATNRVYLSDDSLQLAYGDYAIMTVKKNILLQSEVHPRLHQWFQPNVNIFTALDYVTTTLVPHPGEIPPEFTEPGETCLQANIPPGGGWMGQWLFHGYDDGEGMWYSQLTPGATYRVEVWLRQEGIPDGRVRFMATGPYGSLIPDDYWTVTGEWQRFTYNFTGPDYPDPANGHATLGLQVPNGPGTLWVDNFLVYRYDEAHNFSPFTPNRLAFDEAMAVMPPNGPKPAVRFYSVIYFGHSPMERLLSNDASTRIDFITNVSNPEQVVTIPQAMNWALVTGSSPADRVVPFLTLSEEYTEVEWLQLVEYLGVPYDPAVDTPESKPWAYLRYQQRGEGTPWTDEFREIIIEFGNETWHNGFFGWDGFGRPGWVHFGGREYGLFANYYFAENVAAQPWWRQYNLGDKIKFALNANYEARLSEWGDSYGELAAQQAPTITTYLGHANYVGPKWETGEEPFQVFDGHGMQETTVSAYLTMFPLIDDVAAVRDQLAAEGRANYRPIAYEGGPSGYYIDGGTITQTAIAELYGKSLGMAVSALDAWLYSSLKGYGHQAYLAFTGGKTWSSHTMPNAGGFRRHAAWLALMLRNRYAPGDEMLETTFQSVPTYEREGEEVPLMSAYTIRGDHTLSVFLLSRKVGGVHDGVDFGNGTTPVTLHLPLTTCSAITRYALTAPDGSPADPSANNIEAENVVISAVALDPSECNDGVLVVGPQTGGVEGGMPPGTVYLYVFETNTPAVYLPLIVK